MLKKFISMLSGNAAGDKRVARMHDKISIRKLRGVMVEKGNEDNPGYALTINTDMMHLGFMMSEDLFAAVQTLNEEKAEAFYKSVMACLEHIKGADAVYAPMYPNFPKQVMDASEYELYSNAIFHYWSFGMWKPDYDKLPRSNAFVHTKYVTIDLVDEKTFKGVFTTLLASQDSISEEDKAIVHWFMDTFDDLDYPEEVTFKENLCLVASILLDKGHDIAPLMKTATDVLRVITYLNDGDISLAENTKFKSMPRAQRKMFVEILERVAHEEDINHHHNKWVALFHNLHVGDYSEKLYALAKKVRNNEHIDTYNSRVEEAILHGKPKEIVNLLSQRPSEFARRLDHVIRSNYEDETFVDGFLKTADKIPTRILLQLLGHFYTRIEDREKKVIFPKGMTQKARVVRGNFQKLDLLTVARLIDGIKNQLIDRFKSLESLGKVWIDPDLVHCPVPSGQRSASPGLFQVARGTRLPIGDDSTLRFFIYWVGQDIDLSATLHDKDFKYMSHISYTNLKSAAYQACHSGDIVSAPKGASEFIDITIDGAVKHGARYVVMNVLVYAGPTFAQHETCYAGWMTRSKPQSKEVYEPKTVQQKIDVRSNARNCVPVVFDLKNRQAVWADLTTSTRSFYGGNNVESNRASIADTLEAIVSSDNKVTLFELFMLHARARGEVVESKEEADTVFSMTDGITPYHINDITSEYMI